ncbi:thioredoxin-like domain-containing protein [Talaromyces proteolyticus]|uniref:Protein disulfide-isomerase n=1 Tax=Talaromyces proteolyticus TaxID=1131652 RepID=A0AAD4Q001_9EURO|nr:thioredoxin-like domain-containing protein [Talaromyces proteolyticus]KAH8703563.1 thioredoxin-like domain-containing protein [Talaromyces proteolyticus]
MQSTPRHLKGGLRRPLSSSWLVCAHLPLLNDLQIPRAKTLTVCMPWFEPCKALNIELAIAAENLGKTSNVDVYEFDCSKDPKFCASMEVFSFPTIRIFDHQEWTRYRGRQKASSIVTKVLKQVLNSIVQLDEHQFDVMKSLDLPLMVLTRHKGEEFSYQLIDSLAQQELSANFFLGEIGFDSPLLADVTKSVTPPFITVFNSRDETTPTYDGTFDMESLLEFLNKVSSPLITELRLDNLVGFMESGLPLAMLFSANEKERKSLARGLTDTALKYRGRVNFVTVDAEKNSFTLTPLGLSAGDLPAFVIQTTDNVFKFNSDLQQQPSGAVDEFVQQSIGSVNPLKVQANGVP